MQGRNKEGTSDSRIHIVSIPFGKKINIYPRMYVYLTRCEIDMESVDGLWSISQNVGVIRMITVFLN